MAKRFRSKLHAYVDYRSGLLNKTQEQLAQAVGMSRVTLRARLFDPDTITIGEYKKIMDALKVSEYEREMMMKEAMK